MNRIHLVPVGRVEDGLLEGLGDDLSRAFGTEWHLEREGLDTRFAFHAERQQHHATDILARLASNVPPGAWRLLGVTSSDLYIPILTFVFGEAQLEGRCAVVSTHRLRQEFYGLPPDPQLMRERLLKEAIHELGHTLGLVHCTDYSCAMASSHTVELIDLKQPGLCAQCHWLATRETSDRGVAG
jgi:archaemetzincin